jgi:outer membrane protein assembly factor BamB
MFLRFAPLLAVALAAAPAARAGELLYFAEGNRLHRVDVDTIGGSGKKPQLEDILIQNASGEGGGGDPNLLFVAPNRDVNGMICPFPDASGRFVMGEDTRQVNPPGGFGIFERSATQIGKLTPTYNSDFGEPFGCAFAPDPDPEDGDPPPLFTTDVGTETIGGADGQLILWFPPYDEYPADPEAEPGDPVFPDYDGPSTNFCKIATDIGTATGVAVDAQGRVYVASASGFEIARFSPPFPTGPTPGAGCGRLDAVGSPLADEANVNRETFVTTDAATGMLTFTGVAIAPNGHLFAASVVTGRIAEYDLDGNFIRLVVDPGGSPLPPTFPTPTGNPNGIGFGADGTLYYADLDLFGTFPNDVNTGDDGRIRRVRFDKHGEPLPPEIVKDGLAFPDAVTVFPGDLERKKAGGKGKTEWRAYAGGPLRQGLNAKEKILSKGKLESLRERWRFRTGAVVTASPVVASIVLPDEGRTQIVYFPSWDHNVYALRLSDGSKLWTFTGAVQPGAPYPGAGSALVARIADRELVFVPIGETMYALDAITGAEVWRFTAGTGCADAGVPPGLCAFDGERNEIETSPIFADGKLFFGSDVNDVALGKGGFFAVDAADGRMEWFFDLESGGTCVPDVSDDIRRFDGYHDETELGLPAGFLASRSGCAFDRTPTGCGNVWSSPAADLERQLVFFGSSNCDTDDDAGTSVPPPPMPPYDEALTALRFDGTPAWRWRPREVDNFDLAFGATPNLFTIKQGNKKRDVVGIGGKDGKYYVIDRDGENELTGLGFDPEDPLALPYWHADLVPGGVQGGVIGTPAIDEKARRIYLATAQGNTDPPAPPQQPTVHALDLDTGDVLWQAGIGDGPPGDASFAPVGATRKLVFVGGILLPQLRIYDAKTGELLATRRVGDLPFGQSTASGPVTIDGTILLGTGIGERGANPDSQAVQASHTPSSLVALCVPGSKGCPKD